MSSRVEAKPPTPVKERVALSTVVGLAGISALLLAVIFFVDVGRTTIGAVTVISVVLLILSGLHIGIAMIFTSVIGLYVLGDERVLMAALGEVPFNTVAKWQYSVIPVFIFLGVAIWRSGVASRTFDAVLVWFGRLPGSLAIGTTVTGAALAASSGTTIGIASAMGRAGIPEMLKAGYRPSLAIGTVCMTGILGQVIPPSILLVIYAGLVENPVGPQLLAGIIPGIILTFAFSTMILLRAKFTPGLAPALKDRVKPTARERVTSLAGVGPLMLILVTIIGGILSGVFTATEAGAVGAVVAMIVGTTAVARRGSRSDVWSFFRRTLVDTAYSTASIFLLLIGVFLLTRVLTLSRVANVLSDWILSFGFTATTFILALIPVYLVLGMFMDVYAMLLITVPVLLPALVALEVDLIWFGVFVIIMAELGLVTPPLGLLIFIVHKIALDPAINQGREVPLVDAFRGALWFVLVSILVVFLLVAFPDLVTWLPSIQS